MNAPMATSEGKRGRLLSEINVTPFVDVMLVLLIIFMATAPMLKQGIAISLPQTKASGSAISKEPFILQITKDKQIYIGDSQIPFHHLSDKLKALFEHRPGLAVYLQADKLTPYGFVAQTLGEIKSSGIQNVHLVTVAK